MIAPDKLPLTSAHWGTYRARVGNGRVQELLAFEEDKDPSPIGHGIIDDIIIGITRTQTTSKVIVAPKNRNHIRGNISVSEVVKDRLVDFRTTNSPIE